MKKVLCIAFFVQLSAQVDLPQKPFYCARHGITEWNILQKQQGKTDIP